MKQFVIFAAILLFGSASFALPEKCVEKAAELKKDKAGKEIKEGKEHKCHENGKWKSAGEWKNGQRIGKWTFYDRSGKKEKDGHFKNGKRDGLWTAWHASRASDKVLALRARGKPVTITRPQGWKPPPQPKKWEGHYVHGQREGKWTYWQANARKEKEGVFQKDERHGKWMGWHINGQKKWVGDYVRGKKTGLELEWFANGSLKLKGSYIGGQKSGEWLVYDANGTKKRSGVYLKDRKQGKWTGWYANGSKAWEAHYEEGEKNGLSSDFYENGKRKAKGSFQLGKREGAWVTWHPNGEKRSEHDFLKGAEEGRAKTWYASGQQESEGLFRAGQAHGKWVRWDHQGKRTEAIFVMGEQRGEGTPLVITGFQMVTEKPNTNARKAKVSTSVPSRSLIVKGALSEQSIQNALRPVNKKAQLCYEKERQADPHIGGAITLVWVIEPTGEPSSLKVTEDTLGRHPVLGCVLTSVQEVTFPKPTDGKKVIVVYPFQFSSEEVTPGWILKGPKGHSPD